ncbi:MAG: DNA methyltransferase [Candidatus Hydrothermia bacterium]|jgi:DNA modification methylase|nr:DNA methyltransferase [Candidatus Hydrothermia bacterium]
MLEKVKEKAKVYKINFDILFKNVDFVRNLEILGDDLTFLNVPEYQRTKHVHRLHPYLGKFVPQLVEVFLKKFFKKGDTIIDPFSGSGTTLVEANVLGINSIGIEISYFNVLIQKVKTKKYDLKEVEYEVKDALKRLESFSKFLTKRTLFDIEKIDLTTDSEYLRKWFSDRALKEILFYKSIIPEYKNQDVLMVILSRSARSARLVPHYDLARPKEPIREAYWCKKHKRYCEPTNEALKFIRRYSFDTIKRLKEFDKIRTSASIQIFQGDARTIQLPESIKADGIFTSPPYLGLIDYHEQHIYAYELFNFPRLDDLEIGSAKKGQGKLAREEYVKDIVTVFKNISRYLIKGAKIFVVVNDKFGLYPEIGKICNFRLIDVFNRPVLMKTERSGKYFFESIFYFEKEE